LHLAWRHILGNAWRSAIVLLCAFLVAGFSLATTLIIRGAETSLQLGIERLGADLLVVPEGAETGAESALLMGKPSAGSMPRAVLDQISAVPGVARVSPHTHVILPADAAGEMNVVIFDPQADFTIRPWLETGEQVSLGLGEAIAGSLVAVSPGERTVRIYDYDLHVKAKLGGTGMRLDQTLFVTAETAQELARHMPPGAAGPLVVPAGDISQVLVQVQPGVDPHQVALQLVQEVKNVTPLESPGLYRALRRQLSGLMRGMLAVLGITWVLAVAIIGMVFSIATNERRREIGVLRVLGATRGFAFRSLLLEASLLALSGAFLGLLLAGGGIYLFHAALAGSLGIPLVLPPLSAFLALAGAGLGAALASVALAALVPALRVCRQDPAVAMRE